MQHTPDVTNNNIELSELVLALKIITAQNAAQYDQTPKRTVDNQPSSFTKTRGEIIDMLFAMFDKILRNNNSITLSKNNRKKYSCWGNIKYIFARVFVAYYVSTQLPSCEVLSSFPLINALDGSVIPICVTFVGPDDCHYIVMVHSSDQTKLHETHTQMLEFRAAYGKEMPKSTRLIIVSPYEDSYVSYESDDVIHIGGHSIESVFMPHRIENKSCIVTQSVLSKRFTDHVKIIHHDTGKTTFEIGGREFDKIYTTRTISDTLRRANMIGNLDDNIEIYDDTLSERFDNLTELYNWYICGHCEHNDSYENNRMVYCVALLEDMVVIDTNSYINDKMKKKGEAFIQTILIP